jgi:GDPmannose 4,6-dehydratase
VNRTIVVTGAAGQDGAYLTERLLQEGSTVHAVVRRTGVASQLGGREDQAA